MAWGTGSNRRAPSCDPKISALPDRLALRVTKNEIIVSALDLAGKNGIRTLECRLDTLNLDLVALLESNLVALDELARRHVNFVDLAIRPDHQVRAESSTDRAIPIFHFLNDTLELGLICDIVLWYRFLLLGILRHRPDNTGERESKYQDNARPGSHDIYPSVQSQSSNMAHKTIIAPPLPSHG